ncbi:MAG: hypothetical protein M3526_06365, partial [Actinomycetota bacterium]|nr:hypothetical protein [Actinomycetota bacterium]
MTTPQVVGAARLGAAARPEPNFVPVTTPQVVGAARLGARPETVELPRFQRGSGRLQRSQARHGGDTDKGAG